MEFFWELFVGNEDRVILVLAQYIKLNSYQISNINFNLSPNVNRNSIINRNLSMIVWLEIKIKIRI